MKERLRRLAPYAQPLAAGFLVFLTLRAVIHAVPVWMLVGALQLYGAGFVLCGFGVMVWAIFRCEEFHSYPLWQQVGRILVALLFLAALALGIHHLTTTWREALLPMLDACLAVFMIVALVVALKQGLPFDRKAEAAAGGSGK